MMLTQSEFRASRRAARAAIRRDRILFESAPIDADAIIDADARAETRFHAALLAAWVLILAAAVFA